MELSSVVFHTVSMQKVAMKRNTLWVIWRGKTCSATHQVLGCLTATAAHHMLPLMAKSLLMTDLTQARGHWDVIDNSWEVVGDDEVICHWTNPKHTPILVTVKKITSAQTSPCGHSLYTSPKEGAGAPPDSRPGWAPGTPLGRGWHGVSAIALHHSALHI